MPTFEVLGLHFGISKTEAKDTFHYWLEILRDVFPPSSLPRQFCWVKYSDINAAFFYVHPRF